jgi:hypothetical protein
VKKKAKKPAKSSKKKPAKASKKKPARPKKVAKKKAAPKKSKSKKQDWTKFVAKHGVVLASAKGTVPSVAEAIAGEPIVGSWWSHPKAQAIFDALSSIDDDEDIRSFKLIDHKITFVHRRLWPALAKLAQTGALDADRVASIQQEHMPSGEHRNIITPYPDWVPDDVAQEAQGLSVDEALALLNCEKV